MPEPPPESPTGRLLKHCAKCGVELPIDGPVDGLRGHCPECLLDLGLIGCSQGLTNGSEFGDYKLVRQLGRGAMGVVYEAVQVDLGRTVALKMILDANLAEPAVRRRFKVEAEAAAKLEHANIVPLYEFGEWDGQPFLSMQLVHGETLKAKIRRGDLCLANGHDDAVAIARLMVGVSRAVAHAHDHGVLHRDLKPANILVDSDGQPHLTDFGLAKILDESGAAQSAATLSGGLVGTPSYMAPEQASRGASSVASDIYSLGAVLYEMLTGEPPFKAPTTLETLKLLAKHEPKKPRDLVRRVPRDLETICLKCLERTPGSRYRSAEAVAEELECWLQRRPIRARAAGPLLRAQRWCRRNPLGSALILLLCAGLAGSLAVLKSMRSMHQLSQELTLGLTHQYQQEVITIWKDPAKDSVLFENVYLAATGVGYSLVPLNDTNAVRLTFAMEITGDPIQQACSAAKVLRFIEARMETDLGRPVAFNLRLQKHRPDVAAPSINKEADFQRLGPLAYISAAEAAPGLQLLVQECASKDGAIFARKELGITNLAEIKGLRVAFGHSNSIESFEAKRQMALANITARDLQTYRHLDPPRTMDVIDSESQYAHDVVIQAVVSNRFDVGDARWHHFKQNSYRGLVELLRFKVPPRVYVARPGLNPAIAAAFSNSLLTLKKPEEIAALRELFDLPTANFAPVTNLNHIYSALTNEIRRFEARD